MRYQFSYLLTTKINAKIYKEDIILLRTIVSEDIVHTLVSIQYYVCRIKFKFIPSKQKSRVDTNDFFIRVCGDTQLINIRLGANICVKRCSLIVLLYIFIRSSEPCNNTGVVQL